jgi:hypothetical protein
MTCNVQLQLSEVGCGVAGCDARAEPILLVTCDVGSCGAFSGLQSATATLHIFHNNERTDYFVAPNWWILAIFHKKQFLGN